MDAIKNEEDFKAVSEQMIEMARNVFHKDKMHSHMIFLISKTMPGLITLLFDQVASQLAQEKKPGEPLSYADRDRVFNSIADFAYDASSVGYFEIAEGWALENNVDKDDPNIAEKVLEQYRKAIKDYKFIQNMPIKLEILTVRGRYRGMMMMDIWKIRRQGEAVWLEPMYKDSSSKFMPYQKEDISRSGVIDDAVDKVIEEESVPS
jgi:hypothetical protein